MYSLIRIYCKSYGCIVKNIIEGGVGEKGVEIFYSCPRLPYSIPYSIFSPPTQCCALALSTHTSLQGSTPTNSHPYSINSIPLIYSSSLAFDYALVPPAVSLSVHQIVRPIVRHKRCRNNVYREIIDV